MPDFFGINKPCAATAGKHGGDASTLRGWRRGERWRAGVIRELVGVHPWPVQRRSPSFSSGHGRARWLGFLASEEDAPREEGDRGSNGARGGAIGCTRGDRPEFGLVDRRLASSFVLLSRTQIGAPLCLALSEHWGGGSPDGSAQARGRVQPVFFCFVNLVFALFLYFYLYFKIFYIYIQKTLFKNTFENVEQVFEKYWISIKKMLNEYLKNVKLTMLNMYTKNVDWVFKKCWTSIKQLNKYLKNVG